MLDADSSSVHIDSAVRVMTYNAHGCVGTDGKRDSARVAAAIAEQAPDIVVLQEIDVGRKRSAYADQPAEIAEHLGFDAHFTCAVRSEQEEFGIALLTARGVEIRAEGCLPSRRDEVRAAQWARLVVGETSIDLVHTHLSIRFPERSLQLQTLLGRDWLEDQISHPHLILCGDLNATPWSPVYRNLRRRLTDVQAVGAPRPRATWPSFWPLLRLDHIFVGHGFAVRRASVPRQGLARTASDHLPLVADLAVLR